MRIDDYVQQFLERDSFFLDQEEPFCWREFRQAVIDRIEIFRHYWSNHPTDTSPPRVPEITEDCSTFLRSFFSYVRRSWENQRDRPNLSRQELVDFTSGLQEMILNELQSQDGMIQTTLDDYSVGQRGW